MRILGESVAARYFDLIGKKYDFPDDGYKGEYIISIANQIKDSHNEKLQTNSKVFRREAEKAIFKVLHNCSFIKVFLKKSLSANPAVL